MVKSEKPSADASRFFYVSLLGLYCSYVVLMQSTKVIAVNNDKTSVDVAPIAMVSVSK